MVGFDTQMKRCLKLWISLLVRAWDLVHDALCRILGLPLPARCVVIYYHTVPAALRQHFARQMDLILSRAQPISTDMDTPLEPGKLYICVTFDDGFLSVKEHAAPELSRRKIPWTVFVPSGCLGSKPSWLRNAHPTAHQDRVMTPEELRALSRDLLVTIGSHTVVHANLLEVGPERAKVELTRSKADLETILGKPVNQFSYPFGTRNEDLDKLACSLGYRRLFSTEPLPACNGSKEVVTGRVSVDPDDWSMEFRLKIQGSYRWLPVVGAMKHRVCQFLS
jgi:peptidoglycan/xylan/chitin deacetylase (PgdA/CDA1 family)